MVFDFAPKLVENVHFHIGDINFNGKKEPWRVIGIGFLILAMVIVFSAGYWQAYFPKFIYDFIYWIGVVILLIGIGCSAVGGKN